MRADGEVLATAAGSPSMYEDDPFLCQTKRGFHMLTRRSVKYAGGYCGSGHLYSADLKTWFFGENVYAVHVVPNPTLHSATLTCCHLQRRASATTRHEGPVLVLVALLMLCGSKASGTGSASQSRERPTLFVDTDGSRYLFTGAPVNVSMWVHSFTLMQINVNAELS